MHLVIRKSIFLAKALDLCLNQWSFIKVLPIFTFLIDPQVRKHLFDLQRHQTGKNGITCILCSCRKDTVIQAFIECKIFSKQIFYLTPLIQTKIINKDKEQFLTIFEDWECSLLKKIRTHQRSFIRRLNPVHIVFLNKLC